MKKTLLIVFVVLVLLGGGVYFVLPTTINWEKYTQEVSAAVKNATGRSLSIQGTPVFTMRPVPVLKLGKLTMANATGASMPNMMTAEGAEIQFDAGALFRRQTKIKKVTLHSPKFFVEYLQDGTPNWQPAFLLRAPSGKGVGFESLMVKNGSALVRPDKYSDAQNWNDINAELFADSLQGPFFLEGNLAALSTTFGFSMKIEKIEAGRSPEFDLRLTNAPAEASFSFTGGYGAKDGDKDSLEGNVNFEIRQTARAAQFLSPESKSLPAGLFQPLVGNMIVKNNSANRTTEFSEVLFKYGTSSATGKFTVRRLSPEEKAALEDGRYRPAQAAGSPAKDADGEDDIMLIDPDHPETRVSLAGLPEKLNIHENSLPKIIKGDFLFSKFAADVWVKNFPALVDALSSSNGAGASGDEYDLDVAFDTVDLNRDLVRQAKVTLTDDPKGIKFAGLRASLPGNGSIEGDIVLQTDSKQPLLTGNVKISADNTAALLRWAGVDVPEEIPQNLLRSMEMSTGFKSAKTGIILENTDLALDRIKAKGGLSVRWEGRKAAAVVADVNELDFDVYFPKSREQAVKTQEEFFSTALTPSQKVRRLFDTLAFLNDRDVSVKLKTGSLSWGGVKTGALSADVSAVRGFMQIRDLSIKDFATASWEVKGGVSGFGGVPSFKNLAVNFDTKRLGDFLKTAGFAMPKELMRSDALNLAAETDGTLDLFDFGADVRMGGFRAVGTGSFQNAPDDSDFSVQLSVSHENTRNFMRLFTDKYRPALSNPGMFKGSAHVLKNDKVVQLSDMTVSIGENTFKGALKYDWSKQLPALSVQLNAQELEPFAFLPRLNFLDPAAVSISGDKKDAKDDAESNGKGFFTPLAKTYAFPKAPLDLSFLGNYNADIQVRSDKLKFDKLVLNNVDLALLLQPSLFKLDVRYAEWEGASVVSIIDIKTPQGQVPAAQWRLRLANLSGRENVFGRDGKDLSFGSMTMDMNLTSQGKTAQDMLDALSGKGKVSFESAVLEGVDLLAMENALSGRGQAARDLLLQSAATGRTSLEKLELQYNVANGSFTLSPLHFGYSGKTSARNHLIYDYGKRTLKGELSTDLSSLSTPPVYTGKLPLFRMQFEGTTDAMTVSDNAQEIALLMQTVENEAAERIKAENEMARQREEENRLFLKRQLDREFGMLENDLQNRLGDLQKKIDLLTPYEDKVYAVQKHVILLRKHLQTLKKSEEEIATAKNDGNTTRESLKLLKEKLEKAWTPLQQEIDTTFTTARLTGIRGSIDDLIIRANDLLKQAAKTKAAHPDLKAVSSGVDDIVAGIRDLNAQKEKALKSDDTSALTLMLADAEAIFAKSSAAFEMLGDAAKKREAEIKAAEEAKKAAEEAKRKAEEAAKKAAEEAEKAAEAERRRTIVRKDGVTRSDDRPAAGTSSGSGSGSGFKLILEEKETAPSSSSTSSSGGTGGIIRRR